MGIPYNDWIILKEKLKEKWLVHHENKINFKDYYLYINIDYVNTVVSDFNINFWREEHHPEEIELTKEQEEYVLELVARDLEAYSELDKERFILDPPKVKL